MNTLICEDRGGRFTAYTHEPFTVCQVDEAKAPPRHRCCEGQRLISVEAQKGATR